MSLPCQCLTGDGFVRAAGGVDPRIDFLSLFVEVNEAFDDTSLDEDVGLRHAVLLEVDTVAATRLYDMRHVQVSEGGGIINSQGQTHPDTLPYTLP